VEYFKETYYHHCYFALAYRAGEQVELRETEDLEIKCVVFQGDSLSPLLFCIRLIPLTEQVNKLNTGYKDYMMKQKFT